MALPYEIRQQIIQCIGTCFYYKDLVEAFFISCGIDKKLVVKYKDLPKFIWAKSILSDLDCLEEGYILERRILTELCKLRKLPDKNAINPDAGLEALRALKRMAVENKLSFEEESNHINSRKIIAIEKQKIIQNRAEQLFELRRCFTDSMDSSDRQNAGYKLEDILERLFPIFDIDYRKSYKTDTQQIDGYFRFEGFDYLVEAKWRSDLPNEGEIGSFKRKVETKLESTRGVFISINGFRDEVIKAYQGQGSRIIFFTGEDIIHILEGRIALDEVLRKKISMAAQEGKVCFLVSNMI